MAKRQRYQRGALRQEPIDLSPSNMSAGIQARGAVATALGQMAEFLNKKAQEQAIQRGTQMVQNLGSQQALAQIAASGGPSNIEQKQAFAVASKFAAGEIETQARLEINRLALEADTKNMPMDQFNSQLKSVVEGFSAGMADADPEQAMVLQQELMSLSQIAQTSYAGKLQTKLNEQMEGETIKGIQARINQINVIAASADVNKNNLYAQERTNLEEYMTVRGESPAEIQKKLIELDEEYITNAALADFARLPAAEQKAVVDELEGKALPGLSVDKTRTLRRKMAADIEKTTSQVTSTKKIIKQGLQDQVNILKAGGQSSLETKNKIYDLIQGLPDTDVDKALLMNDLGRFDIRAGTLDSVKTYAPTQIQAIANDLRTNGLQGSGDKGIDTGIEAEVIQDLESMAKTVSTQLKNDPLVHANKVGLIELKPLPVGASNQELIAGIEERKTQSRYIAEHYGIDTKFLTDEEETLMANSFNQGGINERLAIMGSIIEGFGNDAILVFEQVAPKNPEMAHIAGLVVDNNLAAAQYALKGLDIINSGYKPLDMSPEAIKVAYPELLGGAFNRVPEAIAPILETAKYIYVSRTDINMDETILNKERYVDALQMALGFNMKTGKGGIGTIRGQQVILPSGDVGMDADELSDFLEDDDALKKFIENNPNVDPRVARQIFQKPSEDEKPTEGNKGLFGSMIDTIYSKFDIYPVAVGNGIYEFHYEKGDARVHMTDKYGNVIVMDVRDYIQ